MNRLSTSERARIIPLLCECMSIRAVTRLTGQLARAAAFCGLIVDSKRD